MSGGAGFRGRAWLSRASLLKGAVALVIGLASVMILAPALQPGHEAAAAPPPPTAASGGAGAPPARLPAAVSAHAPASWPRISVSSGHLHPALAVPILMYHRITEPSLAGDSLPSLVVRP